jgi:hypothetical protein
LAGDVVIEQALCSRSPKDGFQVLGRSAGFAEDWSAEAERICTGFGERPATIACPAAVFAAPFGAKGVAVVQVADQDSDAEEGPVGLVFRLLVLPRKQYARRIADPFALADHFPPLPDRRGELPTLRWRDEFLPPRRLADVQAVLQRPESPTLLGGTQALVDGGRLVFERSAPAPELVRGLWALLPYGCCGELWPTTFAFGNALGFDVVVTPHAPVDDFPGYLNEQRAGDYPEGGYELGVQAAAEAGDEGQLHALFRRRGSRQMLRVVALLLLVMGVVAFVMQVLTAPGPAKPLADRYPPMADAERARLAEQLRPLAARLKAEAPPTATAEELLDAIDGKLTVREPGRELGPVRTLGDTERQLRGLLWKQGVKGGGDPRASPADLVERLQRHLEAHGLLQP